MRRSYTHPLDAGKTEERRRYGLVLTVRRQQAATLRRLITSADAPLREVERELKDAKYTLKKYLMMLRADAAFRQKLVNSHGLSLPELRQLAVVYGKRYKSAVELNTSAEERDKSFIEHFKAVEADRRRRDRLSQFDKTKNKTRMPLK